ncbi:MAG: hypothetical protein NTX50_04580 [Candidatus Sumerlaeota bacterium]|nr:hypothetical protein [Candidatus Sumerlaeota bacterium]
MMKTIIITIEDETLERTRQLAAKRHISVDELIGKALAGKTPKRSHRYSWLDECFAIMDRANGDSHGAIWKRSDLHL